jgi:hypothetical protein
MENKVSIKKQEEIKYSRFFVDSLNKRLNLDYKIQPNENENKIDPDIDIYAISQNHPWLNLQIVTREKIFKELFPCLQRKAKATGKNTIMADKVNGDIEKWIIEAMEHKENKYPLDVKKNLTLLIIGNIGPLFNKDYAKKIFAEFKNSEFKGIYSVHLPSNPKTSSHLHNGQIIAVKDIFGEHGETF